MLYDVDDVIRIRHPFLENRGWRVLRTFPSLNPNVTLLRIQLLNDDGTEAKQPPITIGDNLVVKKIGRYPAWQKRGNKN
jgi:hypothetical protein